jgi:toxin-antitoxin system PIN domain toxin
MIAADTNILIHAAHARSANCGKAREFLESQAESSAFVLCELNLVELYMALRNPAVFSRPLSAAKAHDYCQELKSNRNWQVVDYTPEVGRALWAWAARTKSGFRKIIDARIALTLRHHGVTEFATANVRDFQEFGFERVWNPLV